MKKKVVFKGCDMGSLRVGEPAILYGGRGEIFKTSPVVSFFINSLAGIYIVETQNTLYERYR